MKGDFLAVAGERSFVSWFAGDRAKGSFIPPAGEKRAFLRW